MPLWLVVAVVHIRTNLSDTWVRSWLAYNKTHPGFYCVLSLFNWNIRNEITTILMKYNNNNTIPYFHCLKSFRKVFSLFLLYRYAIWSFQLSRNLSKTPIFTAKRLQIRYLFCTVRNSASSSYVCFFAMVSFWFHCISFCFLRLIFLIIDALLSRFCLLGTPNSQMCRKEIIMIIIVMITVHTS